MPKRIDKIKKLRYKEARLQGDSIKGSLLKAGYSNASAASKNSSLGVVKVCEQEIMDTLKASDLSVDWIVGKLNTELENIHAKSSDRVRILELLGKYLNMFKDNTSTTQVAIFQGITEADLPPIEPPIEVKPSQEVAK